MTYTTLSAAVETVRTHLTGSYALTMAEMPHNGDDISACAIAKYIVLNPGKVTLYGKRVGTEDVITVPSKIFNDGYYLCSGSWSIRASESGEVIVTNLCISADVNLDEEAAVIKATCQSMSPASEVEEFWPVLNGES